MRLRLGLLLAFLLWCPVVLYAQSCTPGGGVTCTPNMNLWLLPYQYPNYNVPIDTNFSTIDAQSANWPKLSAPTNTFIGAITAAQFNGPLNGTAALANAFSAPPNQCPTTPTQQIATGIGANGDANCVPVSGGIPPGVNNGEVLIDNAGVIGSVPGFVYQSGILSSSGLNMAVNSVTATQVGIGLNGGFYQNLPYLSITGLTAGEVACLFTDGTAHPCSTSALYWNGIVVAPGTSSVSVVSSGAVSCAFDGAPVLGHYVVLSTTAAGECHDAGTSLSGGTLLGVVTGVPSGNNAVIGLTPLSASSGSTVYPGAGIPNSTGSAWSTSYGTSGTGNVALTGSPAFTGTPSAPTAALGTNTGQLATTAFVTTNFAPIASPGLTGTPSAPTAAPGTNTTQIATTAFTLNALAGLAPLASPAFTGTPTAPTAALGTNTTQLASTAFVQANKATAYICGTTAACSATVQTAPKIVTGNVPLVSGAATVTGMPAFTSTTSYNCSCADATSAAACKVTPASATSITLAGTTTDTISYLCVGN